MFDIIFCCVSSFARTRGIILTSNDITVQKSPESAFGDIFSIYSYKQANAFVCALATLQRCGVCYRLATIGLQLLAPCIR